MDKRYFVPERKHQGDAGYDLRLIEPIRLAPGEHVTTLFNVRVFFPYGWFGVMQERSSMGKQGIHLIGNVIDEGYKGEVGCTIRNGGTRSVDFIVGERVAQLVLMKRWVDPFEDTLMKRGDKGFGSTGR